MPTAADKRYILNGIEELVWIAALKPTIIAVSEYRDAVREYLEIVVLTVTLRPKAKVPRIAELIHRSIPYPIALVTSTDGGVELSFAHKRTSQAEKGRTVVKDIVTATLTSQTSSVETAHVNGRSSGFVGHQVIAVAEIHGRDFILIHKGNDIYRIHRLLLSIEKIILCHKDILSPAVLIALDNIFAGEISPAIRADILLFNPLAAVLV